MDYSQAIVLAIVQGLTEFLPISSSGHLVILQKLFGLDQPPVLFDILVHFGTLGAIIYFLRKQLILLFKGVTAKKKESLNTLFLVFLGTIPAGVAGFYLQDYLNQIFNSLRLVGFSLILTGGLLFSTRLVKKLERGFKDLRWLDGLLIGFFQALAILPGVSRSGSTITAGLWRKLDRETAFIFSFYLAIPAILGALFLQVPDLIYSPCSYLGEGILGMVLAGIVGYFSLGILEKTLKSAKFYWFGIYCLVLGLVLIV